MQSSWELDHFVLLSMNEESQASQSLQEVFCYQLQPLPVLWTKSTQQTQFFTEGTSGLGCSGMWA